MWCWCSYSMQIIPGKRHQFKKKIFFFSNQEKHLIVTQQSEYSGWLCCVLLRELGTCFQKRKWERKKNLLYTLMLTREVPIAEGSFQGSAQTICPHRTEIPARTRMEELRLAAQVSLNLLGQSILTYQARREVLIKITKTRTKLCGEKRQPTNRN